ncbi:MAG: tyrosine decarboxylase MfnA [Spirochaetales bacterium]|nr:tyrosine decarboxylase MfnA [Spirochaetales bacterium]
MEDKKLSSWEVRWRLYKKLKHDLSFTGDKIVGSMCTYPHPFAQRMYAEHLQKNVGDPGLFTGTVQIEQEAVRIMGRMLSHLHAHGAIVTGGTEANILAMWTAKEISRGKKTEIIVPEHAHFSFDKAARMLGCTTIKIPCTDRFVVDVKKLRKKITGKTMAIVGVAGSTALGTVDPIEELSDIAHEKDIYLHIDAAFGGFVLPFLSSLGRPSPSFDFSLPGVSSITIDPHKMGMSVIPAGGILYRTKELARTVSVPVTYLAGGETALPTIVGTRSGAAAIACWALFHHLGLTGYQKIIRKAMDLTDWFAVEVNKLPGFTLITPPVCNVAGIVHERLPAPDIAKKLRSQGWAVSLFNTHLRIVLMPHVKKHHLKAFLKALKNI